MNHARLGGTDTHDPCRIDIVGDVHGAFGTLLDLLQMLGYRRVGGRWRHPEERRLLFLGDYIDRGPRSYEVYRLVRTLCEEEMAFALLGNHELNAIAFATRADGTGLQPHLAWSAATAVLEQGAPPRAGFVRDHRARLDGIGAIPSNIRHHRATLASMNAHRYSEMVDWFLRLPLWLETDAIRAVHAAWMHDSIELLRRWAVHFGRREPGVTVARFSDAIAECTRRAGIAPKPKHEIAMGLMLDRGDGLVFEGHRIADLLFSALTGIDAPVDPPIRDAEGSVRGSMRLRWYLAGTDGPLRARLFMPSDTMAAAAGGALDSPLDAARIAPRVPSPTAGYPTDAKPVFFGHYGLRHRDPVRPQRANVACLDYSGYEYGGELVAYRFDGAEASRPLDADRMLSVPAREQPHPLHAAEPRSEDPRRDRPCDPAEEGSLLDALARSDSTLLRRTADARRKADGPGAPR